MPGPWSDTRQGAAFEQTTEWYESDLEENTEYEVEVAFNEDFSDAVRHTFRTQRTDRSVELRSVTINPEGDVAVMVDNLDFSRETDGAGSGVYNHTLNLVLDQPRSATVSAIAVSSQAQVVVDPPSLQLAAASFPQFTVTVTNSGRTRVYRFTISPTVPDLLEFDNVGSVTDITSDGTTTMWVSGSGLKAYGFHTKQELGEVPAFSGTSRNIAYDFTNETLWINNEEYDPADNYSATGRSVSFPGSTNFRVRSWHGDHLYAKQRANNGVWFVANTLTTARAASITLDIGRSGNNAVMWRNDDHYFVYNPGEILSSRFQVFNADLTRNTVLEDRFVGLESYVGNARPALWGSDTHLFLSRGFDEIIAYNLTTGVREITIGANFRGAGDFQLRRGGVINPRDLWGNAETMWVLNNELKNAEFTGDRTKLVAFNRSDGTYDASKTYDIQADVPFGQGLCGSTTHLFVLADRWLRAWTHAGVRDAARDLYVQPPARVVADKSSASACWFDGTNFAVVIPTLFSATIHWYAPDGTRLTTWDGATVAFGDHPLRPHRLNPPIMDDLVQSLVIASTAGAYVDAFDGVGTTAMFVSDDRRRIISFRVRTNPHPGIEHQNIYRWVESGRLYLSENTDFEEHFGFTAVTGLFRDGNDLWVIEPTLPVAAKFTIQSDGSIARNLS